MSPYARMAELGRRAGFRNQSVNSGAGSSPASCTMIVCAMIRNCIRCAERIECHHARCIDKTRGVGRAGRLRLGAIQVARKGSRVRILHTPPCAGVPEREAGRTVNPLSMTQQVRILHCAPLASSSTAEHSAVNRGVVGSNPTLPAIINYRRVAQWTRASGYEPEGYRFESCRAGHYIGVWLSLVERYVRDVEAAGSNPATPTRKNYHHGGMAERLKAAVPKTVVRLTAYRRFESYSHRHFLT